MRIKRKNDEQKDRQTDMTKRIFVFAVARTPLATAVNTVSALKKF